MSGNTNIPSSKPGDKVTVGRMKGNILIGDKIYKLASKELSTIAHKSYENCENKKILVNCIVTIKKDTPINMKIVCTNNRHGADNYHNIKVDVNSDITPVEAIKTPISVERVIKQISKTNNTPFEFENITVYLDDGLYVPSISTLNELRRTALEMLEQKVIDNKSRVCKLQVPHIKHSTQNKVLTHPKVALTLNLLNKDLDYDKLDTDKIDKIYLPLKLFLNKDYYNIIHYLSQNYKLYIYMPIIIKSHYRNIILNYLEEILQNFNVKGFVISNIADFELLKRYHKNYDFVGNYSLNIFNNFSLEEYKKLDLTRTSVSREVSKEDLKQILEYSNMEVELIVYGNLPIMAINYCLLGKTNKCCPDCGANCTKDSTYYLKDRLGYEFRIITDNLQTVTLICNSKTLSLSTKDIPINHVRVDMLNESIDEINKIVDIAYNREKLEGNQFTNGNFYRNV